MEQLFSETYLEIKYQVNTGILFCDWKGRQTTEGIKYAGGIILTIVRDRKVFKVLNDNTHVIGSWHGVAEWTASIWFPAMSDAGMKFFAWVLSQDDFFAELSARRAMPPNFPMIEVFENSQEATTWLLEMV
jgi:hypothetical protein